jgi:hypothetical protein
MIIHDPQIADVVKYLWHHNCIPSCVYTDDALMKKMQDYCEREDCDVCCTEECQFCPVDDVKHIVRAVMAFKKGKG